MDSVTLATGASSSAYFSRLLNLKSNRLRTYRHKERVPLFLKSLKCVHNPNPTLSSSPSSSSTPLKSNTGSSSSSELAICKLRRIVYEFQSLYEPIDRVKRLLHYATLLPRFDESQRVTENRVTGCTAQVWLDASLDEYGRMRFSADSDSEITKGFCSCLIWILDGAFPEEVLRLETEDLAALNVGLPGRAHSRVNTWHNVLISMQKRSKALVAERQGKAPVDSFPSLVFTADDIGAKGSNAEAYLISVCALVKELVNMLKEKKIGVFAHFTWIQGSKES